VSGDKEGGSFQRERNLITEKGTKEETRLKIGPKRERNLVTEIIGAQWGEFMARRPSKNIVPSRNGGSKERFCQNSGG